MSKKDDYLLRLINENIDLHNQLVVYRSVVERNGLTDEANRIFKSVGLPYEVNSVLEKDNKSVEAEKSSKDNC